MKITVYHRVAAGRVGESVNLNDYAVVARVDVSCLEEAFQATNHIDADWTLGEGVEMLAHGGQRSTSVGDVFAAPGGFYAVASCGFSRVTATA